MTERGVGEEDFVFNFGFLMKEGRLAAGVSVPLRGVSGGSVKSGDLKINHGH